MSDNESESDKLLERARNITIEVLEGRLPRDDLKEALSLLDRVMLLDAQSVKRD